MDWTASLHLRCGRDALPSLQSPDPWETAEDAEKLQIGFEIVAEYLPSVPCGNIAFPTLPSDPRHQGSCRSHSRASTRLPVQRDDKRVRLFTKNRHESNTRYQCIARFNGSAASSFINEMCEDASPPLPYFRPVQAVRFCHDLDR